MAGHSYLRTRWIHSNPDMPVDFWFELDADRWEVRKVEIWADGRFGYAFGQTEVGGTGLSDRPIPSLDFINEQLVFQAETITKDEFEMCWTAAIGTD